MKRCSKCGQEKSALEFDIDKRTGSGLHSACKPCRSLVQAAHYQANKERVKAAVANYQRENASQVQAKSAATYQANKGLIRARQKEYYRANAERIKERTAKWAADNMEKVRGIKRTAQATRRARKASAGGEHSIRDVLRILALQRWMCAACKADLKSAGYQVDHIDPLARGGTNWHWNLQCLCPPCNRRKNARDPIEWAQSQGRLL